MDFNIFWKFPTFNNTSQRYPTFENEDQENGKHDVLFNNFFERPNSPSEIHKHMEDMFNKVFSSSFGILGVPNLEEIRPSESNPRSLMLKDSDEECCRCQSSVKEAEDSDMWPSHFEKEVFGNLPSFTYSKFSSVKTVHLPDGTVEEHRTYVDSDGKKTTKVRRTINDISHEIITKSDKQGLKEKEENFVNLDEKDLPDFEKEWNNKKRNPSPQTDALLSLPDSSPSYFSLLKKFFW